MCGCCCGSVVNLRGVVEGVGLFDLSESEFRELSKYDEDHQLVDMLVDMRSNPTSTLASTINSPPKSTSSNNNNLPTPNKSNNPTPSTTPLKLTTDPQQQQPHTTLNNHNPSLHLEDFYLDAENLDESTLFSNTDGRKMAPDVLAGFKYSLFTPKKKNNTNNIPTRLLPKEVRQTRQEFLCRDCKKAFTREGDRNNHESLQGHTQWRNGIRKQLDLQ